MQLISSFVKKECSDSQKTNNTQSPFVVVSETDSKFCIFPKGGSWTCKESASYVAFLLQNEAEFEGKPHSKLWDLYKRMAEFVGTRNFRQCKSYHHQQNTQFNNVSKTIENLKTIHHEFYFILKEELQRYEKETSKSFLEPEQSSCFTRLETNSHCKNAKDNLPKTSDEYQEGNELPMMRNIAHANFNMMVDSQSEEWIECHKLFLEWTSRLKELMAEYPQI